MQKPLSLTLLVSLVGAALIAACGESTPAPKTPDAAAPSASAPAPDKPAETAPPKASATAPTPTPPASASAPAPKPASAMPAIEPTKLAAKLKEIGLDVNKLPTMAKLKGPERSKVMPLISEATGIKCEGCHVGKDWKKETPKKEIGRQMWDNYLVKMKTEGGLFCDSCHHGKDEFLERKDKDAVSAWMDANLVKKMGLKDGKDPACATCHTDMMEMHIFEKVWKVKGEKGHKSEIESDRPVHASSH